MYESPFTEVNNRSASKIRTFQLVWNQKVHYRDEKSQPLVHILIQMNKTHSSYSTYFNVHCNITLPSTTVTVVSSTEFPTKILYVLHIRPMHVACIEGDTRAYNFSTKSKSNAQRVLDSGTIRKWPAFPKTDHLMNSKGWGWPKPQAQIPHVLSRLRSDKTLYWSVALYCKLLVSSLLLVDRHWVTRLIEMRKLYSSWRLITCCVSMLYSKTCWIDEQKYESQFHTPGCLWST